MQTVTLDEALDFVERLPRENWQTLVSIIQKRDLEIRRAKMTAQAKDESAAYKRGELETSTLDEFLKELDANG
jgi:peptidyl-tRNA hydrolase